MYLSEYMAACPRVITALDRLLPPFGYSRQNKSERDVFVASRHCPVGGAIVRRSRLSLKDPERLRNEVQ